MRRHSFQYYLDLLAVLIHKDFKLKYKRTVLGYFWSVLNPLLFALVCYVAFKTIIRIQVDNYLLFLLTALFPWYWFSNCLNGAPSVFLGNTSLIKKLNFPRSLLLVSQVFLEMIHFVLSIPIILVFVFVYDRTPHLSWFIGIPLLLVIQFSATFGLALLVATVNLFFRDLEKIINIAVTLLFYFTPIIYAETMVPPQYDGIVYLNPFAALMLSWRYLLMDGVLDPGKLVISAAFALVITVLGVFVYKRLSWKFAEIT